jgi:hypothetical protein
VSADNAVEPSSARQGRPRGASTDLFLSGRQDAYIAETLTWCCDLFGASHARFIRPMDDDQWIVYTRHKQTLISHVADWAEVAMAYTVGLGRHPFIARKPRISLADGSSLRPIALASYVAIPVICQDRLVGVIEFAGEVRQDIEAALASALPRLSEAAERLIFDPALNQRRHATASSRLALDSAVWSSGSVTLSSEELRLLSVIDGRRTVEVIANITGIEIDHAIDLAARFTERGLVEVLA